MNTNLTTFDEQQLMFNFKFADLAGIYNTFATELGIKTIKKFRDKQTGVKRILQIQEQYSEEIADYYANQLPLDEPKPVKKTGSRFDTSKVIKFNKGAEEVQQGTIQHSLISGIVDLEDGSKQEWSVSIEDLINHIILTHTRPRSNQPVDREYVIHNIKWFIKKGSLEIVA